TTDTRAFAANTIPGTIHAVQFDMGRNGYAYYDVDFQNVSGPGGSTYNSGGQYRNDGVDIEACSDAGSIGYNVGWTAAGEFLSYTVQVERGGLYDITVRASSGANGGSAKLSWDGTDMASPFMIPPTGGWQAWTSVDLGSFALDAGTHNLRISMMSAGFNVNRVIFTLLPSEIGKSHTPAPARFALEQNYPNPFNPATLIRYSIPRASHVKLVVYNLLGEHVRTLVDQEEPSGSYSVRFDASALSSGVYFYRLDAGSYSETRRLTLLR
ncbi:MAG TPA: carbohydrate-binding protein, partial [Bacteroidota bacterium]|nr:carbohydrate-binding protein [Bacteroidota bacterium]